MNNESNPVILGPLEPDYFLIGHVLTNKLKEGSTWTSCKPKPKALCALCEYVCLYIHLPAFRIHGHNIMTSYHSILAFSITISRISRVLLMQDYVEPDIYQGARGFSSNQSSQSSSTTTWISGYDPLDMVSLILVGRHPPIPSSLIHGRYRDL